MKFGKLLKTPFLTEHLRWLLLYHCKIHLYCLRILLTIRLNFAFFFLVLFQAFFTPSNWTQNSFMPTRQILGVFFMLFTLYLYL